MYNQSVSLALFLLSQKRGCVAGQRWVVASQGPVRCTSLKQFTIILRIIIRLFIDTMSGTAKNDEPRSMRETVQKRFLDDVIGSAAGAVCLAIKLVFIPNHYFAFNMN